MTSNTAPSESSYWLGYESLYATQTAVFNILLAMSTNNDRSPRAFDKKETT
jgi:hypothetical protein